MLKKWIKTMVFTMAFFGAGAISLYAADYTIDTSNSSNGTIAVSAANADKQVKVTVEKSGNNYQYTLSKTNKNVFPLQMGDGTYKITVYEQIEGSKYRPVETAEVTVSNLSPEKLYTSPNQKVDFNSSMSSIQALNGKVSSSLDANGKLEAFHKEIINTIEYDFAKAASNLSDSTYVPVIDNIYSSKKGICYDYAALLASILRSNNIPTKLQTGYSDQISEYHAWNEVLINGTWYKVDCTYDAQANKAGASFSIKKDNGFTVVKEY